MLIFGIETSCDETGLALVEAKGGLENPQFKLIRNLLISQIKVHKKFGGVVPHLAKREHQKNIPLLLKELFSRKRISAKKNPFCLKIVKENFSSRKEDFPFFEKICSFLKDFRDLNLEIIGVTVGPGLSPCLWQGVNFAKLLSLSLGVDLIPVNHLEAHIFSVFLGQRFSFKFPSLVLLISGGHTQLILIKDWFDYKILGETRDDAVGEAFDKVGRMLGLSYPAGPQIEERAKKGDFAKFNFPLPMVNQENFDFSFAGLKTAVYYQLLKEKKRGAKLSNQRINDYLASFQEAAFRTLLIKTRKAALSYKVRQIIVSGGVSANGYLRRLFKKEFEKNLEIVFPKREFCTDNGAMVALTAYFRYLKGEKISYNLVDLIKAEPNLNF